MDQKREKKKQHPCLPADYVSLAQLQERWLQKQREEEMRKKQKEEEMREKQKEEEMRQKQIEEEMRAKQKEEEMRAKQKEEEMRAKQKEEEMREKQREEEMREKHKLKSVCFAKGTCGGRGEEHGGPEKSRAISDRGKGKEIPIECLENKAHKKKKHRNRHYRTEKYEKGSNIEKEKLETETNNFINGEIEEVLGEANSGNRLDFRDGSLMQKWGKGYTTERKNVATFNQLKQGPEARLSTQKKIVEMKGWEEKRSNHNRRREENEADKKSWDKRKRNYKYRSKKHGADASESNAVKKELKNNTWDENLEAYSERGCPNGDNNGDECIEDHIIDGERESSVVRDQKAWEKRSRNGNYWSKEYPADVSQSNAVEKKLKNNNQDESLEAYGELSCPNGDKIQYERIEASRVDNEGSNSDLKADELVLGVETLRIDEKTGGVGEGHNWRYRNQRSNNRRQFRGGFESNISNQKAGDGRRYGGFARFGGHSRMNKRLESEMVGMMWVRKEDRADGGAP